ncbi:MAG: hypothetical protein RLZZ142_2934 [Verrucomicrobiota bacterium]|jgi:hypothetical protein
MFRTKFLGALLAVASVLAAPSPARADIVLEYHQSGMMQGKETLSVQNTKSRMDFAGGMLSGLSLLSSEKNGATFLHHPSKTFFRLPETEAKNARETHPKLVAALQSKPTPTGEKETIGNYQAEVFETQSELFQAKFWVVQDFPNYRTINAALSGVQGLGSETSPAFNFEELPGMVVKMQTRIMGLSSMSRLISSREEALDPNLFEIPKDYQPAASMDALFTAAFQNPESLQQIAKAGKAMAKDPAFRKLIAEQVQSSADKTISPEEVEKALDALLSDPNFLQFDAESLKSLAPKTQTPANSPEKP